MRRTRSIAAITIVATVALGLGVYTNWVGSKSAAVLAPPSLDHWFGTDLAGRDVLAQTYVASWIAAMTVAVVAVGVHLIGISVGATLAQARGRLLPEFLQSLVHYWITMPILLIAIFVMILLGSGQLKLVAVLIVALAPTQALYAYARFVEAQKQPFATGKRIFGVSRPRLFWKDMLPYVHPSLRSYMVARLPEILVMDLAFNYLGLGVQPPHASIGRMLFAGLPFMFSGWWIWMCPVLFISLLALSLVLLRHVSGQGGHGNRDQ